MRVKLFLFTLLNCCLYLPLISQPTQQQRSQMTPGKGMIVGAVVDKADEPLAYATIYIYKNQDTTATYKVLTTEEGRFNYRDIDFGDYFIEIQYVGYEKYRSSVFSLNDANPIMRMTKIQMQPSATRLDAVEVKGKKEMIQSNLDKKVYNVESSIMAEGATAVEILQDIPSVEVDLEGNVSLRGNSNVTILVDGRPSNLTLEQIPSSQIESIEVITNPSARLEPDGMSGILNVVLKKKKESGFNGLVGLGGALTVFQKKAYFDNYNGNINLNYSYDKINVFLNYNYRHFGRRSAGSMERTSWFNTDTSFLLQNQAQENSGNSHNIRTGMDWFINKMNSLSFTFGYNFNKFESNSELTADNARIFEGARNSYMRYLQNRENTNQRHNYSANINYIKKFEKKGRELTADLYFTQMNGQSYMNSIQQFEVPILADDYYQRTQDISLNRNASAQVDFVTPVGNGGRIETGYKFSLRAIGQDYSLFDGVTENDATIDSSQINDFLFTEYINAAYFIYSNTFWKKFKMQVGLRAELANTSSNLKSADTIIPNTYPNIFPTVHLKYEFNEKHTMQLSYSRRVSRPRVHQLNPFVDISDKLNLNAGNPNLKPEFVNSLELGYLMFIKNTSLNLTAFYRQRDDIISRYTQLFEGVDEDGMPYTYTMTSFENLNKSQNFGFEAVFGQRIFKFWRINLSGDFYRVIINSDNLIDENLSRDWSWGVRLNQTFTFKKNFDMQLNFRYRSASLTTGSMGWGTGGIGQGRRSPNYSLGFGVKKGFFNNSFVVSLNVRDLIYRKNTEVHTYAYEENNGYDALSIRQNSSFQVNISLTYKINNFKRRVDKHAGGMDDEMMEE